MRVRKFTWFRPRRAADINTGQEVKTMEESSMTATETARLIDWLKANGHTDEDAIKCIKFIATGIQQEPGPQDPSEKQ